MFAQSRLGDPIAAKLDQTIGRAAVPADRAPIVALLAGIGGGIPAEAAGQSQRETRLITIGTHRTSPGRVFIDADEDGLGNVVDAEEHCAVLSRSEEASPLRERIQRNLDAPAKDRIAHTLNQISRPTGREGRTAEGGRTTRGQRAEGERIQVEDRAHPGARGVGTAGSIVVRGQQALHLLIHSELPGRTPSARNGDRVGVGDSARLVFAGKRVRIHRDPCIDIEDRSTRSVPRSRRRYPEGVQVVDAAGLNASGVGQGVWNGCRLVVIDIRDETQAVVNHR